MRLVLVDVDGTLLDRCGSERAFALHLLRHGDRAGRPGVRQLCRFLAFAACQARYAGRDVFKRDKAYLAGLEVDAVVAVAETFARQALRPRVRPEMLRRIDAHHRQGDQVVLLTGTPAFLARPLARSIGVRRCVATVCAQAQGRFTGDLPLVHPFGAGKLTAAAVLAHRLRLPLEDAIAYADSSDDLPLLSRVGGPVVVAPRTRMARIAAARGWAVLPTGPVPGEPGGDGIGRLADFRRPPR